MEKIIDRLGLYIFKTGISESTLTQRAGISVGCLSIHRKKGTDLSLVNVNKIIDAFPDINRNWLIWGEGEMLNDDDANDKFVIKSKANNNSTSNINIRDINPRAERPLSEEPETTQNLIQALLLQQQMTLKAQEMLGLEQKRTLALMDVVSKLKSQLNGEAD